MAYFKGSLTHYRPQLLLPALFTGPGLAGRLRLERGGVQRTFDVQAGVLVGESSNVPTEHLAQILATLGLAESTQAAQAFEAAERLALPFGAYLVQSGLVTREALIGALTHKAKEAFLDCYTWEAGEAEFTPELPASHGGIQLSLPLEALHREALAYLPEWRSFKEIFPRSDLTFRVFRSFAPTELAPTSERILQQAERGATLGELWHSVPEGAVAGARLLLSLYRRGALSPQRSIGPKVGQSAEISDLLGLARGFLHAGKFDSALAVAGQVLECAPVPEAQALYRDAERKLALALCDELFCLDERLVIEELPRPAPPSLTADDLYLYSKLSRGRSVRETLRTAAMGELAASRSMQRLMVAGLLRLTAEPQRKAGDLRGPALGG